MRVVVVEQTKPQTCLPPPCLLPLHQMLETFYCFLVGGLQGSNTFPVDIHPTKTVGDLKKEIIKEAHPTLDDIAAHELTLYKVEIENELDNSYAEQDLISHLPIIPEQEQERWAPREAAVIGNFSSREIILHPCAGSQG